MLYTVNIYTRSLKWFTTRACLAGQAFTEVFNPSSKPAPQSHTASRITPINCRWLSTYIPLFFMAKPSDYITCIHEKEQAVRTHGVSWAVKSCNSFIYEAIFLWINVFIFQITVIKLLLKNTQTSIWDQSWWVIVWSNQIITRIFFFLRYLGKG